MQNYMYTYVLVNTARTWERVRVTMPFEEMKLDNIQSVDAIVEIAESIYDDSIIQGYVNAPNEVQQDDYWIKNTEEGMSDCYIEAKAEKIIRNNYL